MNAVARRWRIGFFAIWLSVGLGSACRAADADLGRQDLAEAGQRYLSAVRAFADIVLTHGRDVYGPQQTPLFVDGLNVETLEPVRWKNGGETWVLSNFASQQPLLRLLDGLTAYNDGLGEPLPPQFPSQAKYRQAAVEATRHALEHLRTPNGLLYWGGHLAWDLEADKPVGQGTDTHELKTQQPYFELMWRVDPKATQKLLESIWGGHIVDWSSLDYNRHAGVKKPVLPRWDHAFAEDLEVPFPSKGGNLSFANVTPPLLRAGTMLAVLGNDNDALTWTRRLTYRWQQGKDPNTGLCGGQLSYRAEDRAQQALGHVHTTINEAKIVASYHQVSRYHHLPLAQMQAAQAFHLSRTYDRAGLQLARDLIQWASDDLKIYARRSYDPRSGTFLALMTDGTPIRWQESKTGYYVPESFAPVKPDGVLFWTYATAYRLTGDREHLVMVQAIAKSLGLGEVGEPLSRHSLSRDTDNTSWSVIYALLELSVILKDDEFLRLACRVGDNILKRQSKTGLFPRPERQFARTGDEAPLALLHLAAALTDPTCDLPRPILDSRFFHCEHDGPLAPHQQKRADKRTYDHLVYYGGP